jgi:hypothetical protein
MQAYAESITTLSDGSVSFENAEALRSKDVNAIAEQKWNFILNLTMFFLDHNHVAMQKHATN